MTSSRSTRTPGEAWRSSAGAAPAGGARDPLSRVPQCDTRALARNAGRRGTRPRRRCRRSSLLACAPSSCGRSDAGATVRFRWTAHCAGPAPGCPPPPPPRQVGRAFPVEVRHLGASGIGDAAATAARDTAVVAAAAAAGCCCALTRTEPGRNRAHRTHEAPASDATCSVVVWLASLSRLPLNRSGRASLVG